MRPRPELAPPDAEEAGAGLGDGGVGVAGLVGGSEGLALVLGDAPAVEVGGAGAGVEPVAGVALGGEELGVVAAGVAEHVAEGPADLAGGFEDAVVVAVVQDLAFALPGAVEGLGGADGEALEAA